MLPFSITCTTCKTRLKVRDESAIGQILSCPKCGGLVMVKPPEAAGSAPSDSAETRPDISTVAPQRAPYRPGDTLPATNFEDIDSILSDAPPRPRDPIPTGSSKKARVSINDAAGQSSVTLGGASAIRKASGKTSADAREPTAPESPSGSSSTILPSQPTGVGGSSPIARGGSPAGQSPSTIGKSPAQTVQGDAATLPTGPAPAVPAAAADSTDPATAPYPFAGQAAATAPAAEAKRSWWHWPLLTAAIGAGILLAVTVVYVSFVLLNDTGHPIVENPVPPLPANPQPSEPLADGASQTGSEPPTEDLAEQPAAGDPPVPAGDEPESPADAAQPENTGKAVAMAEPTAPARSPAGEDPLGIIPSAPAESAKPPATATADPLAGFGKLIEPPTADPIPVEQAAISTADLPAEIVDGSDARDALPRPEPRNVDVAARLADPLPAIEVSGVPLADFLQFVQDLSTIPITLDGDSLWFARASARADVHVKGQNLSVGEALAGGLKPLGLQYTVANGQLRVALIEPSPLPKIQYPVKDLVDGDEQRVAELGEWMQSLVRPQSWGEDGGELTVAKDSISTLQTRAAHAELLMFFEKLRVARGLAPLSRFDRSNFALDTRLVRAQAKLDTPIALNFSQPTVLTKIVERIEDAAQVRILIDWQSLADAGWNPDGEATLLAENQSLGQALTRLTGPMDLTWRAIDASTLQILSAHAAQEKLELEFYPLGESLSAAANADEGESLLARLRASLGEDRFREAGGRCDLRYDRESKHLLASLPQPLQKKLAAILLELQSSTPAGEVK